MSWLSDIMKAGIQAIAEWSRKRGPERDEGFNRPHMLRIDRTCIYCEQRSPAAGSKCPGPTLRRS